MDDEAAIRITAIIVIGLAVAISGCVYLLGVARDSVPRATASAQVQMVKTEVKECNTLPTSERAACIKMASLGSTRSQAVATCNQLNSNSADALCLSAVQSGTSTSAEAVALAQVAALETCNKISGDDKALITCVATAMGKR